MKYDVQVPTDHYSFLKYLNIERWISYYHQVRLVHEIADLQKKKTISLLEIGVGDSVVSTILRKYGHTVETADIDRDLHPTYTDALPELKKIEKTYDCILCSEVLEHLEYADAIKSAERMAGLTNHLVISVPHISLNMTVSVKLPGIKQINLTAYADKKSRVHKFDGQHYWELGTKGYSSRKFINSLKNSGLLCIKDFRVKEFPYHHFFLLKTKSIHPLR